MFDANKPDDNFVDFIHAGVPMAQCCAMFYPFVFHYVKRYLCSRLAEYRGKYRYKTDTENVVVKIHDPIIYYSDDYLKKQIEGFIYGYSGRFSPIEIPIKNPELINNKVIYLPFEGQLVDSKVDKKYQDRPMTWCDLLYLAVTDVCADKHIIVTRYPITDYFSSFINRIRPFSTTSTVKMKIGDTIYDHYPMVDLNTPKGDIESLFQGSLSFSNLYLDGLCGDYDGDQVTMKPVYSIEANADCEKAMFAKGNFITISAGTNRNTGNEGIQTLYQLTMFKKTA